MQLFKRTLTFIAGISLVALPIFGWLQRQAIADYVRLYGYNAPLAVEQLATDASFSDQARKLFYVYRPELLDRSAFNQNCTINEESIVLGCYVEQTGIYIFDVDDPRLSGVEEVTAAHEMLHVAYERLSSSEREWVDGLTQEAFEQVTNDRVLSSIQSYHDRDPSIVPNELHSIIGTEVRNIPLELENYYSRYFQDRGAVVSLAEDYEKAFTEREDKIAEYDKKLQRLKSQIEQKQADLNAQATNITAERKRLDALLAEDRVEEYNAAVPPFNASVQTYNGAVRQLKVLITQHNDIVEDRNELVVEEQELVQAIDSRPETINTE